MIVVFSALCWFAGAPCGWVVGLFPVVLVIVWYCCCLWIAWVW